MMKLRTLSFLAVAALAAAPTFAADTWTVDKSHSEALFTIKHLVSRVSGRFNDFSGTINTDAANPAASSVEFSINAASIDTSDAKRDEHLKSPDFFETAKFPTITFKSSKMVAAGANKYMVEGTLTLHGVSKQVVLPVEFLGFVKDPWGNDRAGFAIETTLNRKDFGIVWNKALDAGGFVLGDDVKVVINLEAVKKKA
jgi:polyisoprenoid-binding protein YceI